MNLKQFADLGGCKVVLCGAGWGGRYGYIANDAQNCIVCGFKTKTEARQKWMTDTFGKTAGTAVQKLLSSDKGKKSGNKSYRRLKCHKH